jgi:hypothetical protein
MLSISVLIVTMFFSKMFKFKFQGIQHAWTIPDVEDVGDLQEQFLELKTHSMKYNLIFTGIPHSDGHKENTDVLHIF